MKKWIDQVETIFFLRAWLYFSPSLRWRCGTKLSKRRRWNGFFHLEKKNRELKKGLQVEDGEDQSMNPREMKQNVIQSIQLIKSIHNRLEKNSLLQANTPVLLALSGGQDSMTMVSFFLQIKNQRRYKVGWCWCNHLWRYDVFHTMHHLMRLAFTTGEPISFLIEPTTETPTEGGVQYLEKRDGPPFRTFATTLPFCERKARSLSALLQKREVKDLLVSPSLLIKGGEKETFFSQQSKKPFFPNRRRRSGGWIAEEVKRRQDDFSTSSALSPTQPKKSSLSSVEAVEVTKTKSHGQRKQGNWSFTEGGARRSRYQSCQRLATFHRFRILQVGHTASDRIETGVFHLLRGSGMRGVAGIQRSRLFRKLYPKRFCFSNFYAIDFKKFEANQQRFRYHQQCADLPLQRRVQPSFYQEVCERNISFEKRKVTSRLNKKQVKLPRLRRLMRTACFTVKGFRKHLSYGGKKIHFFYSAFLERKKETLHPTKSGRDDLLLLHRPLLSVSRSDVRRVCHFWQLPIYPDTSNQTFQYARNRIRNQLLPTLRFQFNRQVDGTFFHFATLLSTEQLYLDFLSQRLFPSICVVARDYVAFNVAGLHPFPTVIRRQILKQILEKYATQSLHLSHIETLCRVLEKKRPTRHQFSGTSCLFLFSRKIRSENLFQKRTAGEMQQDNKETKLFKDELPSFFFPCRFSVKRAEGSTRSEITCQVIQNEVISSQQSRRKKVSPPPFAKDEEKSWKNRFTIPTHCFLPTTGSFLFLGSR